MCNLKQKLNKLLRYNMLYYFNLVEVFNNFAVKRVYAQIEFA